MDHTYNHLRATIGRRGEKKRAPIDHWLAETFGKRDLTVFFCPNALLRSVSMAHHIVASTLKRMGNDVLVIRCDGALPRCIVMDSRNVSPDTVPSFKKSTCRKCSLRAHEYFESHGLETLSLDQLLDEDAWAQYAAAREEISRDPQNFLYAGHRFGLLCLGYLALFQKIRDFDELSEANSQLLEQLIESTLLSFIAIERLGAMVNIGSLVFYSEYYQNVGAALAAKSRGGSISNITNSSINSVDFRYLEILSSFSLVESGLSRIDLWDRFRSLHLSKNEIDLLTQDIIGKMFSGNKMVYSPQKTNNTDEIISSYEIDLSKKLLVAFTSSEDELITDKMVTDSVGFCIYEEKQPFSSHDEWLMALIDFVEQSDKYQLIVRLHPRKAPNRREGKPSEHLKSLKGALSKDFRNTKIVWPQDPVSSFDLLEICDLALNAWSTLALDSARLAVPNVASFYGFTAFPVNEFIHFADEREAYFSLIERVLNEVPSLERILHANRWLVFHRKGNTVDLSDIVPRRDFTGVPEFELSNEAERIEDAIVRKRLPLETFKSGGEFSERTAQHEEAEAIKRQLRRIIWHIVTGRDSDEDFRLFNLPTGSGSIHEIPEGYDAAIHCAGHKVTFLHGELKIERTSKLLARLAPLCCSNAENRH